MTSLTPFIGRDNELLKIADYLQNADCHLLTLVGMGGIGKTRLLQEFCNTTELQFPDGIYIVPLVGVNSPDLIPVAISNALQVSFQDAVVFEEQLLAYIKNKTLLLALDNLEHLLDGATFISSMLQAAPDVKILATSREPLQMPEEWLLWVHGLPYPGQPYDNNLNSHNAVALFIEVAQRIDSEFSANEDNLPYIVRICQLVEGMPLAIELTASWVKALSCRLILHELEQGLDAAAGSLRRIPERHRGIRTILDHTWERLSNTEQLVLRQLSIFRGGFQLEAAKTVAGATVFDLASLMDKSLIKRTQRERYDLHELLRQYAEEKLAEDRQIHMDTAYRHAAFYATVLEEIENCHRTRGMENELEEIEAEFENIRAGWQWSIEQKNAGLVNKYVYSLNYFYYVRGLYQQAIKDCENAIANLLVLPQEEQRDYTLSRVRTYLGEAVSFFHADYPRADRLLRESFEFHEKFHETQKFDQGLAYTFAGRNLARQGEFSKSEEHLFKGLELLEEISAPFGIWLALSFLGEVNFQQEKYEETLRFTESALNLAKTFSNSMVATFNLAYLGIVYAKIGQEQEARQYLQEALSFNPSLLPIPFYLSLLGIAILLMKRSFYEKALRVLLAIKNLPLSGRQLRQGIQQYFPVLEAELGPNEADRISAEVKVLLASPESKRSFSGLPPSFIEEPLELLQSPSAKTHSTPTIQNLTKRELQVLQLAASGLTNLDIASRLVISEGTVKRHTHNIYQKLGAKNRSQAVLMAKNLNLI